MSRPPAIRLAAAAPLLLCAAPAHAHLVQSGFGAFYDGALHFFISPEDVLVVLALALLAGFCGRPHARTLVCVLAPAWLAGAAVASVVPHPPALSVVTAVTFGIAGGLVAAGRDPGRPGVGLLGVLFGLLHGFGNGATMGAGVLTAGGVAATVFVLISILGAVISSIRVPWQRIVLRVAGSWLAAISMLMFGWNFR